MIVSLARTAAALCALLLIGTACGQDAAEQASTDAVPARTVADAPRPDSATARQFDALMAYARAENLHEEPIGVIMQRLGERFAGAPYVAGMLDEPAEEVLVTRLDAFDCVLFVETALALAQTVAEQDYTFEAYADHLEALRYRSGTLDGYCSRLHYFSDWIADNEERGNVANITRALGGEPLEKELTFMSANRDKYPKLAASDSLFAGMQQVEANLEEVDLYYIPQDRIAEVYDDLQAGDIIATATSLEGLDVTHTGLVYKHDDGGTGFLHASTSGGVKVSPDLQSYIKNNAIQIGIVVARPQPVRD